MFPSPGWYQSLLYTSLLLERQLLILNSPAAIGLLIPASQEVGGLFTNLILQQFLYSAVWLPGDAAGYLTQFLSPQLPCIYRLAAPGSESNTNGFIPHPFPANVPVKHVIFVSLQKCEPSWKEFHTCHMLPCKENVPIVLRNFPGYL